MNVLTTTMCYPRPGQSDQGVFVQRRAAALARRPGVDVQVVSPVPWCPVLRPAPEVPVQHEPLPAVYPRMWSPPVLGWAADGAAYAQALKRTILESAASDEMPFSPGPIDLIDAHFVYPDGVGAWLAGRNLGIPVVVTVRGKIVSLSRRRLRRWQIAAMLRGVDARIAVSGSLAGWVRRVGGADLDVDVIPNGVDAGTFYLIDRSCARETLGWPQDVRHVLSVGHLQRLKGFDRLVAIWPAVRQRLGDVRLVLAGSRRGESSFQRRLAAAVRRVNAEARTDAIRYVGPVAPGVLNVMYNAADVVVMPSRSEGWCNAITEALATGTPVVATDVGGNREQLNSPELGTVVPDGDPVALVEAIAGAASSRWNRVLMAAHGGARTWGHVADEVEAVFARVLERRAADRHAPARPARPAMGEPEPCGGQGVCG